jgi:chromate transport protein ChrA
MLLLAIAVKHIPSSLPPLVLALLTGLNAAAVGLIFFAAHKLTQMTAVDSVTRIVLFMSAAIGTCYTATWLFPVLTVGGGIVTLFFDLDHVQNFIGMCKAGVKRMNIFRTRQRFSSEEIELPIRENAQVPVASDNSAQGTTPNVLGEAGFNDDSKSKSAYSTSGRLTPVTETPTLHRRQVPHAEASSADPAPSLPDTTQTSTPTPINFRLSMTQSLLLVAAFFSVLITVLVLQATLSRPPRELRLFTNLFIAGTILFGGGPVVIPLLQVRFGQTISTVVGSMPLSHLLTP